MAMLKHHMLRRLLKDYETNPRTQYDFHKAMTLFWLFNFCALVLISYAYMPHNVATLGFAYLTAINIYACADTEYTGMSAALAAMQTQPANAELARQIAATKAAAAKVKSMPRVTAEG